MNTKTQDFFWSGNHEINCLNSVASHNEQSDFHTYAHTNTHTQSPVTQLHNHCLYVKYLYLSLIFEGFIMCLFYQEQRRNYVEIEY